MDWPELGWVDAAMVVLMAASALVGMMRGLTFEVLSLAGWFVAWFASLWLGPSLALWLPAGEPGSALNRGLAFAGVFVVALVVWGLGARAASRLVAATPLRPLDRGLGALFGAARGLLVLLVVATLLAYTPADRSQAWRASRGAAWLSALLASWLPYVAPTLVPDLAPPEPPEHPAPGATSV